MCGNSAPAQSLRSWLQQWHERINKGEADVALPALNTSAVKAQAGLKQKRRAVVSSSDSEDDWFQV